jgi:hypothetical protein
LSADITGTITAANTTESYGLDLIERTNSPVTQWTRSLDAYGRGLRVSLVCIVLSFDDVKQTVVVRPVSTEIVRVSGQPTVKSLPDLADVQIQIPRAGNFVLTMPITAGDECLVVFTDVSLDAWFQSGGVQNQMSQRRHSLTDGIAIFGPWSQPNVLADYSTTSAQLRSEDGTVIIDVAEDAITVTAPTVTVNASSTAHVTAPTVNVAGSTAVNITGGHCSIDGKNFLLHDHFSSGVTGPTTGPVA